MGGLLLKAAVHRAERLPPEGTKFNSPCLVCYLQVIFGILLSVNEKLSLCIRLFFSEYIFKSKMQYVLHSVHKKQLVQCKSIFRTLIKSTIKLPLISLGLGPGFNGR